MPDLTAESGVKTTEWVVQYREGAPLTERPPFMHEVTPRWTRETALAEVAGKTEAVALFRTRVTFPDLVGDWHQATLPEQSRSN